MTHTVIPAVGAIIRCTRMALTRIYCKRIVENTNQYYTSLLAPSAPSSDPL